MTVRCGDHTWEARPGTFVFLPRGLVHTFTVTQPLRGLQITAPARFECFAAEPGRPAQSLTLPPPELPDIERLLAIATKYGYEILGPSGQKA